MYHKLCKLLLVAALMTTTTAGESYAESIFKKRKSYTPKSEEVESKQQLQQENTEKPSQHKNQSVKEISNKTNTPLEAVKQKSMVREQPLTPAQYDSLVHLWDCMRKEDTFEYFRDTYINYDPRTEPLGATPDSVYERRLKALVSPIQLPFNDVVRGAINRFTNPNHLSMKNVLARAQHYFPMIEQELIKAGLPVELRSVAIIESALRPYVTSSAGAAGLWQFMPATGRAYGLEINSMVDERLDPVKSTKAACRLLKDLYGIYGDWYLALAAYNYGAGNVNKAMARAGGKTFWDIYFELPAETQGYIPNFIAATYTYAYHKQHGIESAEAPMPLAVDTVQIKRLLHLGQVSSTLKDVPHETLKLLNPQYKLEIIPATTKSYPLMLPQYAVTSFIEQQTEIHSKDSTFLKEYLNPANIDKKKAQEAASSRTIYHTVKRGETLGSICRKYGVSQKNVMKWNGIKNPDRLREGQKLKIIRK